MADNNVKDIEIPIAGEVHPGLLGVPSSATGIVVFAHGSGSSRLSKRNNYVADIIRARGMATLLFDLLTEEEDQVYETRFNIPLLKDRLIEVTHWLKSQEALSGLSIGYFGASTGAAAALKAAAMLGDEISAVVSRGGRPDLAGADDLSTVRSPTLLIVGGHDDVVIELNQGAYAVMTCVKELQIVPGATHLFEEPGTLEQAANLATDWFAHYLGE
jgi:predicted alpha/beta-hydrolase family hydrolase